MKKIARSDFMALSKEWLELDNTYDAEFQAFLDNPMAATTEYLGSLGKERFHDMGQEWASLDQDYDNFFTEFLHNPTVHTSEKLSRLKDMQGKIYPLEDEIYIVAERFFSEAEMQRWKMMQKRLFTIEREFYEIAEGTMTIEEASN